MNHYDTLEVSPNASPEVIRAAYKSLIQRFHPDKHPGNQAVAARATAIAQAYEVLSDAAQRAEYNISLQYAAGQGAQLAQGERPGSAYDGIPRGNARHSTARPHARQAATEVHRFPSGAWWLLLLSVAAGVGALASLTAKKSEPGAELASIRQAFASATATEAQKRQLYSRKLDILEQHPELFRAASAEKSEDMAARTFALLENPLVVRVGGETPGAAAGAAELTIRKCSLLVGSFDTPDLLVHMVRHRERLVLDLSARLAKEDPDRFAGPDAEGNLKRIVLDTLAASLGTDSGRDYPSTYFESPGRYGVVDVLLPDRFKLVPLNSLR